MKKEIEAFVNAANEQELEAAWNNLSAEEQRVFDQLMEEEPPEDALAFFAQLYDDAPKEQTSETVNISENEIYFKRKPLTEEQKKHSSYVDENGNLHVKNLSAFWIPELTTTEKVGHTTYTVTGSYEGKESFLKKLERIVAKNADKGTSFGPIVLLGNHRQQAQPRCDKRQPFYCLLFCKLTCCCTCIFVNIIIVFSV